VPLIARGEKRERESRGSVSAVPARAACPLLRWKGRIFGLLGDPDRLLLLLLPHIPSYSIASQGQGGGSADVDWGAALGPRSSRPSPLIWTRRVQQLRPAVLGWIPPPPPS